jgi:hypothetical protein
VSCQGDAGWILGDSSPGRLMPIREGDESMFGLWVHRSGLVDRVPQVRDAGCGRARTGTCTGDGARRGTGSERDTQQWVRDVAATTTPGTVAERAATRYALRRTR